MTGSAPTRQLATTAALVALPGVALLAVVAWLAFLKRWSPTGTGLVNFPAPRFWLRLWRLSKVWDEFSDIAGRPNSAFRSGAVNDAVGGVADSWHMKGLAMDLPPLDGRSLDDLAARAAALKASGVLHSYLREPSWLHVQVNPDWTPPGPVAALLERFHDPAS